VVECGLEVLIYRSWVFLERGGPVPPYVVMEGWVVCCLSVVLNAAIQSIRH
jgi:hypothetical protein